jgi:intracellular septation protein A
MNIWTYRRPFNINGEAFLVKVETGFTGFRTVLMKADAVIGEDKTATVGESTDYRNHHIRVTREDGSVLEVESGYIGWWTVGIAVRVNGTLVHESHPGRTIRWPMLSGKGPMTPQSILQMQQQQLRDREQWVRNKPSLIVDITLGLLFFIVSKATGNLTTAALVGAAAGLAVVIIQRFVKVDLLGGLAMFGVFTLLLSAGFSLYFQDERMVQLKGTILGGTIALIILGDALLNRGRYFGARMARYIPGAAVNPQRLAVGIAGLGLTMASLNLLATNWLSKDAWLIYTTFLDAPLAILLTFGVFKYARQ